MKSGEPFVAERQPSPVEDLAQAVARDEGELEEKNQDAYVPGQDSRIEQAETRTDEANTRTEEANVRTNQANTRADEANTRTEEANTRTEEANTRTDEAEARKFMETDPTVIAGVMTAELHPFAVARQRKNP